MFKWSRFRLPNLLTISIVAACFVISASGSQANGSKSRKLDEVDESKCGGNPCGVIYASPPPPSLPPPPPPPPHKKPPPPPPYPSYYCPPPPSPPTYPCYYCPPPSPPSDFVDITGPPGELYPIDDTNGDGGGHRSFAAVLPAIVACGLVALFMMW